MDNKEKTQKPVVVKQFIANWSVIFYKFFKNKD